MIEQKGDILQSDMFEHIEKIHRAIETDLTEMQKNIEQSLAENRQLSSQLDTEINNCKIALIQIEDQIQQQATDVEAKYTDLFNQIAEEIDTQEKEAYNQFSAESAANREQAITILNEKLSELTDTATSRITAISEDTELRIKDLQSSISSYMTELQTSLDKAETDSRLRADTIADTSQTFLDDLQENINGRIIEISDTLTNKVDNRLMVAIGLSLIGGASLSFGALNLQISNMNIAIPNFFMGMGMGLSMVPIMNLSVDTLRNEQMTNATGIQNLLKNIGSAIGTSLVATMLTRFAQVHQYMLVGKTSELNPAFIDRVQSTAAALAGYTEQSVAHYMAQYTMYGQLVKQATLWAFIDSFRIFGLLCFAVIPLLLLMKKIKKHSN